MKYISINGYLYLVDIKLLEAWEKEKKAVDEKYYNKIRAFKLSEEL